MIISFVTASPSMPFSSHSYRKNEILGDHKGIYVEEDVKNLKEARLKNEIKYTIFPTNVVTLKKTLSEWRICVEFSNLNFTCLNDSYPYPT